VRPRPFCCISPHLDDAVLSCGDALALHPGALIVTVLAGTPADGTLRTEWDELAGFSSAAASLEARLQEDRAAGAVLFVDVIHLDFVDAQYGEPPPWDELIGSIQTAIDGCDVLAPLGLFHGDHRLVAEAGRAALRERASARRRVVFYEDSPYRVLEGGRLVGDAVGRLADWKLKGPVRIRSASSAVLKARAISMYSSQLRALRSLGSDAYSDLGEADRYWFPAEHGNWL
jgi:LmbE family N-acetylglucosaminyl deacetylase